MGITSVSDLDKLFKREAKNQLKTFNKTFSVRICAYMYSDSSRSSSSTCRYTQINFQDPNPPESVYNNDLSSYIKTGNPIRTQDIGSSVANAVRSTVDRIEGIMGTRYLNAYYCHGSCHSSCHGSRGRR